MGTTAYHMVHYRQFAFSNQATGASTLEQLCRNALSSKDGAGSSLWQRPDFRLFDISDGTGRKIFLNKVADLSSAVFGEMCLAQSSDLQPLLQLSPSTVQLSELTTAVVYDLDERKAPDGSQFIRRLVYWLAVGNHLFFVKTLSMTPELMRAYLEWLLKIRTTVVGSDDTLTLNADFDKSMIAGDIGDVRSLRISGKSAPQISVKPSEETHDGKVVKTSRKIAERMLEYGQAIPLVQAVLGPTRTKSLVSSLGDGEYLAVDASVKVRGKRTEASRTAMRNIAGDLDEMTDAKVQVEGKDGKVIDGDAILRTRMPFDLPYEGSNLLEFDNVADQLQEVYNRFVKDGKIKA